MDTQLGVGNSDITDDSHPWTRNWAWVIQTIADDTELWPG